MSAFRFVHWISEGKPVIVYGDGKESSRDYTYLDDVARGVIAGLKPLKYEVINLGSDSPIVLIDTIRLIEELVGKKAMLSHQPFHPADARATWANIKKAEELLGWRPQVTFREGITALVKWYQANREWGEEHRNRLSRYEKLNCLFQSTRVYFYLRYLCLALHIISMYVR